MMCLKDNIELIEEWQTKFCKFMNWYLKSSFANERHFIIFHGDECHWEACIEPYDVYNNNLWIIIVTRNVNNYLLIEEPIFEYEIYATTLTILTL